VQVGFRVHNGTAIEQIDPERMLDLASLYELDQLIPGKYSSLFVLNLYLLDKVSGVDPHQVISEIKHLEGLGTSRQTKEAAEFKGSVLRGLWHKHFFPMLPSTFAHNITKHFGKNGLEKLVNEVFDSAKSNVVTREMINNLARRVVEDPIVDRGSAGKLTGEWIIFAKENGQNYYLSISPHTSDDENLAANLKTCSYEFPFIGKYVP
jgi:hypothetical protein